jgi:hypothetical protein
MSKRASGPPRRPRNPIAKDVRTPKYRPRVVPDKRWLERLKGETKHADDDRDKDA